MGLERLDELLVISRQLIEHSTDPYYKNTARYFEPLALKKLDRMPEARPLYEEAIRDYRSMSLKTPGDLDLYLLRVMCLRDLDQNEKAFELLEYVTILQPDRPEPLVLKVSLLETLGRTEEAEALAKKVQGMVPGALLQKAGE